MASTQDSPTTPLRADSAGRLASEAWLPRTVAGCGGAVGKDGSVGGDCKWGVRVGSGTGWSAQVVAGVEGVLEQAGEAEQEGRQGSSPHRPSHMLEARVVPRQPPTPTPHLLVIVMDRTIHQKAPKREREAKMGWRKALWSPRSVGTAPSSSSREKKMPKPDVTYTKLRSGGCGGGKEVRR